MAQAFLAMKDEIVHAFRRLSPADQADVIVALNESFADVAGATVDLEAEGFTPDVIAELERRSRELEADPSKALSWDEVDAEMTRRYGA
jgi:putative addiction module component (TIGR02574 family)